MRTTIVAVVAVALAAAAGAEEVAAPGGRPALTAQQLQAIMPRLDAGRAGGPPGLASSSALAAAANTTAATAPIVIRILVTPS